MDGTAAYALDSMAEAFGSGFADAVASCDLFFDRSVDFLHYMNQPVPVELALGPENLRPGAALNGYRD